MNLYNKVNNFYDLRKELLKFAQAVVVKVFQTKLGEGNRIKSSIDEAQ